MARMAKYSGKPGAPKRRVAYPGARVTIVARRTDWIMHCTPNIVAREDWWVISQLAY